MILVYIINIVSDFETPDNDIDSIILIDIEANIVDMIDNWWYWWLMLTVLILKAIAATDTHTKILNHG